MEALGLLMHGFAVLLTWKTLLLMMLGLVLRQRRRHRAGGGRDRNGHNLDRQGNRAGLDAGPDQARGEYALGWKCLPRRSIVGAALGFQFGLIPGG
jgi:hypothetical protein